jgi:hypothetical protein
VVVGSGGGQGPVDRASTEVTFPRLQTAGLRRIGRRGRRSLRRSPET